MPANSYGSYSPQEDNPFPIETNLATIAAGGDPTAAQNMLDRYRVERATAMGNYNVAMGGQHDFAKQQLAAQMADNAAKNLKGFAEVPGGVGLIAGTPGYGYLTGGASPGQIGAFTGQQTRLQNATVAEKGGAAANSLIQAGYPPTNESVAGLTGLPTSQGVPLRIQTAEIGAANKAGPTYTIPVKMRLPDNTSVVVPVKVPYGASEEEIRRRVGEAQQGAGVAYPNQGNVPGIDSGAGTNTGGQKPLGGGRQAPGGYTTPGYGDNPLLGGLDDPENGITGAPPSRKSNLPTAPQDRPAGPPAAPQTAPAAQGAPKQQGVNVVTDPHTQQQARIAIKTLPTAARLDVLGGMDQRGQEQQGNQSGGVFPVFPDGRGGYGVRGKSGQFYPLPGVG